MLNLFALASGSSGNCTLVKSERANLLVDIGVPLCFAENALLCRGVSPRDIDAVLITHEHSDHIGGAAYFAAKYGVPIYMDERAADGIMRRLSQRACKNAVVFGEADFFLKDITITPLQLRHDVCCTGFGFYSGGRKVSVVTDLGTIPEGLLKRLEDSDAVMLEANHDPDLLRASRKYPEILKRRILSDRGHLSNMACAEAVTALYKKGKLKGVMLAHLSEENNYPALAYNTVKEVLARNNIETGVDIRVTVAPAYNRAETARAAEADK